MPSCIVKGCSYSWKKKDPNVILHSFPNDITIIKSWLLQTKQDFGNIDDFCGKVLMGKKTDAFRMCSQHFAMDCYYQRGMITSLKKDALPTIFPENTVGDLGNSKAKIYKPPAKRACLTAPSNRMWTDVDGRNSTTSVVMGLPLRIVKIETDITEPSTSSSRFPQEKPFCKTGEISIEKRKMMDQVHWSSLVSRKSFGSRNSFTVQRKGRTVGTNTEYFPGQKHKATHTYPNIGVIHREIQTENTEGVRCLCGLSSLQQEALRSRVTSQPGTVSTSLRVISQAGPTQSLARYNTPCPWSEVTLAAVSSLSDLQSFTSVPGCLKESGLSSVPVHNGSEPPLLLGLASDRDGSPFKDQIFPAEQGVTRERLKVATVKSEDMDLPGIEIPEASCPDEPFSENKYIVFDSCLNKLLLSCRCLAVDDCDGRIVSFKKYFIGSSVSVNATCSRGHAFHMWDSQP